jgi:hypothetical protein
MKFKIYQKSYLSINLTKALVNLLQLAILHSSKIKWIKTSLILAGFKINKSYVLIKKIKKVSKFLKQHQIVIPTEKIHLLK